jgi:Ca-activated chloride channel family protein
MNSDPLASNLRRVPLLLASLAAVLLAGASPAPAPPTRGSDGWTVDRGSAVGRNEKSRDDGAAGNEERVREDDWRSGPDGDRPGGFSPFLLTRTDAQAVVTGPVAHTVLKQEWANPNREPLEATYIFPLPDNAAVTAMTLRIGARRIEAEMRRREEARAIYERARGEGRVAALLDQERPNVFAQRVANIMPGERIDVTIEFDQEVRCDDGECAYVLPTVVGPRFVPARQADPGRIDPPVAAPGVRTGHRLSFALDLDAGMPIRDLRSPSHRLEIDESRTGRARLRLASGEEARLDRDLEVRFRLGGRDPEFGVLAWRGSDGATGDGAEPDRWRDRGGDKPGTFTLFLQPPVPAETESAAEPRELTFVLDCSGSMRGAPIEAAKNVVRRALRTARPGDTLQILRFSDRASGLWPAPVPATAANVRRAIDYLDSLRGEGGTEMLAGIRAALDRPADPERLRLVAFLTDGYIGNETEILGEVRRLLGPARLFSFGIGSSVNRYLLENMAQEGRGAAAFVGPHENPDDFVDRFVTRIATPVFTDLRVSWEGIDVDDLEPALPPDLFAGQPLVIHGRYRQPGAGTLVLEGRLRGRHQVLRRTVTLPGYAADHEALGRLWARARIDRLTRESFGRPDTDTVAAVTDLGLRFRLMTPYTSLVAVDHVVSNRGGQAQAIDVPVELPAGVDYEGIFGPEAHAQAAAAFNGAVASRSYETAARLTAPPAPGPYAVAPGGGAKDEGPSLRYVAPPQTRPEPAQSDAKGADRLGALKEDAAVPFLLVRLIEEDGTQRTVEADGEAWLYARMRRTLVRTLTSSQVRALGEALAAAGAERWPEGDATFARGRSRLVAVFPDGSTRSVGLPSLDPQVAAIVALLQAATAG